MKITLRRIARKDKYTIGKLYLDGVYFCDTLEDKDRGLTKSMPLSEINAKKVYGETAIPVGTYAVKITYSPKFKKNLPRLYNVPGYEGILIHSGNYPKDTLGCILVGKNTVVGAVMESRATMEKLLWRLAGQANITIVIS